MGILFQDFNKYELSLRENIAFGDISNIEKDEYILPVINKVNLNSTFSTLQNGLDSKLGSWFGGTQLSAGQWQKIALARAFMKAADFYILDEPTSSLDPISENEIYSMLTDLCRNKIGIFITHRISDLKRMNTRIVVLKEGMIIGAGSHYDLMRDNDFYVELYNSQEKSIFVM